MPQYIGFSTLGANKPKTAGATPGVDGGFGSVTQTLTTGKKFTLVDENLVLQDFVNSLNIRQGEKVGQPGAGTILWSFIFEQNTLNLQVQLENEIRRMAGIDPRINLNSVKAYPQDNGILIEVEMAVRPFNNAATVNIFFNSNTNQASLQ